MPKATVAARSAQRTRERILEAAILRFSHHSYEETKLRDIAEDVDVDVALVHRYFGSKEQLFTEALVAVSPNHLLSPEMSELSATFTKRILERDPYPSAIPADPLQIFAHSLSSPQAREILRTFVLRDFVKPLAIKIGDPTMQRAALFTACLIGISILRNVLRIGPLFNGSSEQREFLIGKILDVCLNEKLEAGLPMAEASKKPIKSKRRVVSVRSTPKAGAKPVRDGRRSISSGGD